MADNFGYGELTVLKVNSTTVGKILSVEPPGFTSEKVDTTVLGDTFKTFRIGRAKDPGEFMFKVQYDPDVHDTLVTWAKDQTAQNVAIEYRVGTDTAGLLETWSYTGAYATGLKFGGVTQGGNVECDVTVALTGSPTIT
jgi:hypothetical protein